MSTVSLTLHIYRQVGRASPALGRLNLTHVVTAGVGLGLVHGPDLARVLPLGGTVTSRIHDPAVLPHWAGRRATAGQLQGLPLGDPPAGIHRSCDCIRRG